MSAFLAAALFAAVADDPPGKLLEQAAAAFEAKKFAQAAELAEKAAKADPKSAAAPFLAGSAYLRLRQHDAAIKAFTTAIQLDPNRAAAYDRRGDAHLKAGNFKEAV